MRRTKHEPCRNGPTAPGRTLRSMERPVDALTVAVLDLQRAQRAVNALIEEVIERVSSETSGAANLSDLRVRLPERRAAVDRAADALSDALARMGDDRERSPG